MTAPSDIRPDVWAAFRACRLWRTASDEAVAALAREARVREVPRGTSLAVEGDPATEFGVVVAGRARVFYLGADGRQITFETLEAGDPLAAVASLAGGRYPAQIEAATPATSLAWPLGGALRARSRPSRTSRGRSIADLAGRVVNFTVGRADASRSTCPSRLARYVFQRSLQSGRPTSAGLEVDLGMKKGELAMALGTVPETLSRAFAKLKDDGLLEVHGSKVTVLDVRALASLGSGYGEG